MSGWSETPLSDVLADAAPGFACGEDVADGVFQFRMNNITTEGHLDLSKRRRVPRDYRNIERFLVRPGDVLFNATNSPDLVGKTAFFSGLEEPAVFSNHFLRLRPRDGVIDGRYLARWLNLQFLHGRFKGMCRQWVNQATVSRDALLSLRIPLPPLPEQRRIAEILDKADALRAKRRAALAKLDELTQSIFLDMFGDPATNPKGWPLVPLASKCAIAGEYGANVASTEFDPELPRYVRITDVTDEGDLNDQPVSPAGSRHDWEPYALAPGDLLFARSGATVGKTYMHRERNGHCVFAGYMIRFRPNRRELLPEYLFAFTQSAAYKAWVAARQRVVAQPNINAKQYGHELLVPLPPVGLQEAFATQMAGIDRMRALVRTAHNELHMLFASLQHRAFRGEL